MTDYQPEKADYKPDSALLAQLIDRGFFHQCTDLQALDKQLMTGTSLSVYIGFDATADSLHVGSLIQIMMLRYCQDFGHKPIVLMGGGTTKVGDPSGKDETRQLLDAATIDSNIKGIRAIFSRYLNFGDIPTAAIQLNNADWLDELNYVEFLRDIGRHFTINRMMTMDSVKTRLEREQPLTFLEFNYMLLQAYDFLQLHQREGCTLQMGGSDQWGNIVNGIDLTRRVTGAQVFGLTSPLLTKADGSKMGKTATGAIWLDPNKTSPYEFWQFWRNTMDEDVGRFLKLFTDIYTNECDELGALQGEEINRAKIILANAVCALCHGEEAARKAEATAKAVFEEGGAGSELPKEIIHMNNLKLLDADAETNVYVYDMNEYPDVFIPTDNNPMPPAPAYTNKVTSLAQLLVQVKFAESGKDAKRKIAEGIVILNDDKVVKDPNALIKIYIGEDLKISLGKKRHIRLYFHD